MGFLDGLGRMIQGKPVFVDNNQQSQGASEPQQSSGEKISPKVYIVRTECNANNGRMELWVHVKNESQVEVYVDNTRIFDTTVEIDKIIHPGETSDFEIYNGNILQDDNKAKCELKYRTTDGDFFVMQHYVDYGFRNNAYVIDNIKPVGPVSDI